MCRNSQSFRASTLLPPYSPIGVSPSPTLKCEEPIDPVDVKSSYRMEQGFTFELNLAGVADEHRDEFVKSGQNLDKRKDQK